MVPKKSTVELIHDLNIIDETDEIEAKEIATDSVGDSIYETICAMSNEPGLGGGSILLGVSKEEALFPLYKALGIRNPEKISTDIASTCRTIFNHPISPRISTEKVDGVALIRVDVDEASKNNKPIFLARKGMIHGTFRRVSSADIKCTAEDLEALFKEKAHQTYDRSVVPDTSWDDIDPSAIAAYRRLRGQANPNAEELRWSDKDLVYALGGLMRDGDKLQPTLAGLVSFGKSTALRRCLPSHRVDYIRVPGKAWVDNPDGRFDTLDMRGPTVTLISRVISAILDDLPKSLILNHSTSGARQEVPSLPERVIREAVVNCLMHRSYAVHEPIQIIRYANRIEIKNPGYSLKPEDRFDEPGSIHRNPYIAAVLHETLFAETKGSGIRVMRQMMAESGLAPPSFESDRERENFSGRFLFHHFLGAEDTKWLASFSSFELSSEQMKALIFVREVDAIDKATYKTLAACDAFVASRDLKELHVLKLLDKRGQSSRAYYVPGEEFVRVSNMYGSSTNMDAAIHVIEGDNKHGDAQQIDLSSAPEKTRVRVQRVQSAKRNHPGSVEDAIVDLCAWRELSNHQIAELLGMKPSYVSQRYLGPMVVDKRLEYTRPEMVQHPDQKYRKTHG